MTSAPGDLLQNRYRVISLLGQGGMGAVYKAWDTRLNINVALKEMIPQAGLDAALLADMRNQFQQEATVLARLKHPHLVRVTDFFQEGDNSYLVMDFVEGESLASRIARQGAIPESQVLAWGSALLDALAYCHSQGIIHRDIKPQNVIIRGDGQAVLVDFGLAKLWDPRDPRTRTAMRGMGTPEYAPPEQYEADAKHTDPRTDVYSLGALLYHSLTGQAPPTATMRMAAPEQFAPLRTLAPAVSKATASVIMRALQLASSQRWQNMHELASALDIALTTQPTATPGSKPGSATAADTGRTQRAVGRAAPRARKQGRGWGWAVGGLAVLAVALGAGAVVLGVLQGQAKPEPTSPARQTPAIAAGAMSQTATAEPSPTPKTEPTSTPTRTPSPQPTTAGEATDTPSPSPSPTADPASSQPSATPKPAAAPASGALVTFEEFGTWRRGDQPHGQLTQSAEQVHTGNYAAKLAYDFPATDQDFVVFVRPIGLAGQPNMFGSWVYGDGSGHYVNTWVEDAQGEIWSVHLGKTTHTGWKQMAGRLDATLPWPSGHVSGPDNGAVEYPVRFHALVVDRPGKGPQQGTLFFDDISVWTSQGEPAATPVQFATLTPTPAPGQPTPTDAGTPEGPVSAGPLDFPVPTRADSWKGNDITIIVHISGGAPPFQIYHDVEEWQTRERDYPITVHSTSCWIVHSIKVKSADGQEVTKQYSIKAPWC